MSEEMDVPKKAYTIYTIGTFTFWLMATLFGYMAWWLDIKPLLNMVDVADLPKSTYRRIRNFYLGGLTGVFLPFMTFAVIWQLIGLGAPGIFKKGAAFGLFNVLHLIGVYGFNILGLWWSELALLIIGVLLSAAWVDAGEGTLAEYSLLKVFPWATTWIVIKLIFQLGHYVIFAMYYKGFKAYYKHLQVCPTNDCNVKKEAAKEVEEDEPADDFEDDFFNF